MCEPPELDESQRRVAETAADARLIVTAGAGQGKTEVVAARLRHLVDEEGLTDADDVLVLSFSRAAVAAVQGRVKADRSVSRTTVRTFDSFASRLLLEGGEEVVGLSFDRRVRAATELLRAQDSDVPTVDLLRHVIVDEVQDLVGDRAELVLALLMRLDDGTGFTVLGDPLQGIYDFQLDDSDSALSSEALLDRLRVELGVGDVGLEHHYRAQTSQAQAVVSLGDRMRSARSGRSRFNKVRHHVDSLPAVGTLDDLALVLPRWQGRTVVLCETNGQAMLVSRKLFESGIAHRLRRPAEQVSVPSWVAAVLGGSPSRCVDRQAFDDLVARSGVGVPEDAWRLLKATERRRHVPRELDLVELSGYIAAGAVPVYLVDTGEAAVVVSTIHRGKGLEFENVVVIERSDFAEDEPGDAELDERARLLYVAVSRARCRIATAQSPGTRGLRKDARPPHRWFRGYERWQTRAFEFQLPDVERQRPFGEDAETAHGVQDLLWSRLAEGGFLVEGKLDTLHSTRSAPVYELSIDHHRVAVTSLGFGTALAGRLERAWRNNPRPPVALHQLRSDGIETAAGAPLAGERLGVGRWGLWLTLRVGGLAQLEYGKGEEV